MIASPPAADQVGRFRADATRLAGGEPEMLALAVSGGPDSLALLLLAQATFPGRVSAATVDHRLRPENAEEAGFVAGICAGLGVPHAILTVEQPIEGNVQGGARRERYRLLGNWAAAAGCAWLATAHHADDQAETLLMRLARGAGLPGLAGIRARRQEGTVELIRPLLAWRRAELFALTAAAHIKAIDDPSNRSIDFDRTRFRALLGQTDLLLPPRLAAAASHLADCEEALAWAANAAWALRAVPGEVLEIDASGLPRELARRLARRAIDAVRRDAGLGGEWREEGLGRLLDTLASGGRGTLAEVLCEGGRPWRFRPAPPRREGPERRRRL